MMTFYIDKRCITEHESALLNNKYSYLTTLIFIVWFINNIFYLLRDSEKNAAKEL